MSYSIQYSTRKGYVRVKTATRGNLNAVLLGIRRSQSRIMSVQAVR